MTKKQGIRIQTATKIELIEVDAIGVDDAYQRGLDERRVNVIAGDLDPSRIGTLVVSRRSDGSSVVIDGQHRHAALKLAGLGKQVVRCEVHFDLDQQQEAELFLKLNGARKAVNALDTYKAALVARVAWAIEIDAIVKGLNLRVCSGSHSRSISAITALKNVHKGNKNLEQTLRVLVGWSTAAVAFNGELMKGVSGFLRYCESVEGFGLDETRLIKALRGHTPDNAIVAIKHRTIPRLLNLEHAANIVLTDIYNKPRGGKKLPPYTRGGA